LTPPSQSILADSAYERHGYTPPILAKLEDCQPPLADVFGLRDLLNGQSSPGTLQVGQHPSKGTRQIPHTSSSGSPFSSVLPVSHCHWAMACHCLTMTFMVWFEGRVCLSLCTRQDCGMAGPSCPRLHVNMPAGSRAASGLPAVSWKKKRRYPLLGKCWNGEKVYNWLIKVGSIVGRSGTGKEQGKENSNRRMCLP
jgi:hypothetical protein